MAESVRPNFLLVGAHKAATTSIALALSTHPEIFVPAVKEPHFFASPELRGRIPVCVESLRAYERLFRRAGDTRRRGEASVLYLPYHATVIPRVRQLLGAEVRILICLRNPVDRAYSAYLDAVRSCREERLSFRDALAAEAARERAGYGPPTLYYRRLSTYTDAVEAYLRAFPYVHVMLFDDYVRDPTSVLKGTCEFLGVTPSVELPAVRANEGGQVWVSELARTAALNGPSTMVRRTVKRFAPGAYDRLRAWSRSTLMTTSAPLDPDLRRALTDACRPDVIRLQRLLGADLGHWLDG